MLWVDRVGDRRSHASLAHNFSLENGGPAEKGKRRAIEKPRQSCSACFHSSAGTCSARRKKQKNIIAMRTVEFNQALGGGGGTLASRSGPTAHAHRRPCT